MINDDSKAGDLVAIALRSFRESILPVIPADQRFTALMIANALGVAERELAAGGKADAELADAVGKLIDAKGDLRALLPRLCTDIDAGRFDSPERQQALRAVLKDITRARLAVSNPKRLAAETSRSDAPGSVR
ncbi:DUF6285 domain-containing protein [Azospirillum lipoferum]|uniref:DUF6285 domain-containing protein n=1 Tax=Azospirillum lipoferum (strain 4B) TaxID=862719 RepID=G7ZBM0_AZOL4|nr:DUF6285 domain-containing protein [Azospirillum lipoferum]CBS88775.1 conserved protein of unknown function [Azospirillum lipoferum 4B]